MIGEIEIGSSDILLVVDIQNDFCKGGALAVPGADEIVEPINEVASKFRHVVLTQDWHPGGHRSFASAHRGRQPFEMIEVAYGPQILWPDHCVQGTRGAEFHSALRIPHAELILRKGYHPDIDSYSAFVENDRTTRTGLAGYLRERGFNRVFLAGLALDFCVRYSAEDAHRSGFRVVVLEDVCRAIDVDGSLLEARNSFAVLGIPAFRRLNEFRHASRRVGVHGMGEDPTKEDQTEVETKIRAALRSEPRLGATFHLKALTIEPDGSVILEGDVPSIAAKKLALEKVASIPGLTGIVDRLHVERASPMGDDEIRVHVRNAMIEEPAFERLEIRELVGEHFQLMRGAPQGKRGNIDIEVRDGIVTLNGSVPGLTSKRLAGVMAWWVPGVGDVVNGMEVDPPEEDNPDMIEEAVRVALEKDPLVNASQIRVGVRKTWVRLTGAVAANAEREAAERDAWCIFGVDNVLNEIKVMP
jgi:nicotinamidase/pyrazinamidase